MNELIKIQEHNGRKAVSARELYTKLGYDISNWKRWFKKNITENQFAVETEDYVGFVIMTSGNETQDFALSIDFAKKLSMMARTETGEKIRQYFIDVEKKAKESAKPLSTLDILKLTIQNLEEQQRGLDEVKREVLELKAQTITRPEYFTIVGYAILNKIQVGLQLASKIGQKATRICKEEGYPMDEVPDPRFGRVKSYPKAVLQQVFNEYIT